MSTLHSDENANNFDSWLSIIIKILFIILLIIGCIAAFNFTNITNNGSQVSDEAKDDANIILKEVTETAVEALQKRREQRSLR